MLYIVFGTNKVKRKGMLLKQYINHHINSVSAGGLYNNTKKKTNTLFSRYKQFIMFGYNVYPQRFTFINQISPLQNGVEAYPAMLNSMLNAKFEVLILSYIFDYDIETKKFLDVFKLLIKKGIKIKVLVDGVGTFKLFHSSIEKQLAKINGLEYGIFLPPHIPISLPFVNFRNHRKIMIIDRTIAFLGSMNLSKNNVLIHDIKNGVIDITFKIQGQVIDQLLKVFRNDWEFANKMPCKLLSYNKKIQDLQGETMPARIISSGPNSKIDKIEFIIHGAINMAQRKITIVTPYFLPETNILTAIKMAAMRKVSVELIVPEHSDCHIIDWARESNFLNLIISGVKIYRTLPPFDHSKIFIVDDEWIFVGSANWDVRSFKLHFETNIELFSHDLAIILNKIIDKKKQQAQLVSIYECKNITFLKKLRNNAARLITPYG
ncbi:MAG: phospholipase D-like domain-containing protein [Endomicrobium sp.]|nr:phospholipase D-like domain-containing protein [Endomicrobium sp.]